MRVFVFLFFIIPGIALSSVRDANTEKKDWYLTLGSKIESEILRKIEGSINGFLDEGAYQLVLKSLEQLFGKKIAEGLTGMISVGPFIKMDSLLGGFGQSQSQVMARAIIKAVEAAKEEIIMAVEQQFRDETRARLNALISNYEIYNARGEADRRFLFYQLGDMLLEATYIRERIAVKSASHINDLHPYLTVSSLQIAMEKEYTRWVSLNNNPNATSAEVESKIKDVVAIIVSQVNSFYINSPTGVVSYWKDSFLRQFDSGRGRYVRPVTPGSVQMLTYDHFGSQIYSYKMGGEEVEFQVLLRRGECQLAQDDTNFRVVRNFDVYDAGGDFLKKVKVEGEIVNRDDYHCGYPASELRAVERSGVLDVVYHSQVVDSVRNKHKNDFEALNSYIVDGYWPIKRALDDWWEYAYGNQRPHSELDDHFETYIGGRHDVGVSLLSSELTNSSERVNVYRVYNAGGSVASDVTLDFGENDNRGPLFKYVLKAVLADGSELYNAACGSYPALTQCSGMTIQPGQGIEVFVRVRASSSGEYEMRAEARSTGMEVTNRNNVLSEKVRF